MGKASAIQHDRLDILSVEKNMCSFLQVDKDGRMILLFFLILLIRCRLPTNCTCIFAFSHLQNGTYLCISVSYLGNIFSFYTWRWSHAANSTKVKRKTFSSNKTTSKNPYITAVNLNHSSVSLTHIRIYILYDICEMSHLPILLNFLNRNKSRKIFRKIILLIQTVSTVLSRFHTFWCRPLILKWKFVDYE